MNNIHRIHPELLSVSEVCQDAEQACTELIAIGWNQEGNLFVRASKGIEVGEMNLMLDLTKLDLIKLLMG